MKTFEQYPLIAAEPKAVKYLTSFLEVSNKYLSADSIPNPVFIDAKDDLNRLIDRVQQGVHHEVFRWAYFNKVDFMYGNQIAGKVKLAKKLEMKNDDYFAICAEFVDLYNDLQVLKPKIVKRAARSEEERADDYVPPIPTTEVAMKVNSILKEMTDDLTLQYEDIIHNWFVTMVESYRCPVRGDKRSAPGLINELMSLVGADWDSFNGGYKALQTNWKAKLRTKAQSDASFSQRMFLYKNVMKLATIIETKGNYTGFKINHGSVNSAGFSGEITFYFADNSKFVVRNKVVSKYSIHNRPFLQFPTTFHFAVLPNNSVMPGQPSEQEMIEQFAVAR